MHTRIAGHSGATLSSLSRATLAVLLTGCLKGDTGTQPVTGVGSDDHVYVVVAGSLNLRPNFRVTANDQTRGTITRGFSYFTRSCGSAADLGTDQAVFVHVRFGEKATIKAIFPSGRYYYWNDLSPTRSDLDRDTCTWIDVPEEPFNPKLEPPR